MRIALLTDGIWPFVVGGMQKHSYYLCKYLAARGIDVDLYHTSPDPDEIKLEEVFTDQELQHIRSYIIPFPRGNNLPGHYLRSSLDYSRQLRTLLGKNKGADIIYAKGLTAWGLFEKNGQRISKAPVCINVHGYEYFQKPADVKQFLQQLMLRIPFAYINRRADFIYSYGGGITRLIKTHFPEKRGQIIEVPAGIATTFLVDCPSPPRSSRRFVFMGRFEKRKGIKELNDVIISLKKKYDFKFAFIGDVPTNMQINDPDIRYQGLVKSEPEIKTLLRSADVLICPSYSEGMPNVIMEAMASGCAVIATNVGAIDLLVDKSNGWLIPPGSRSALTSAMIDAIDSTDSSIMDMKLKSIERIKQNYLWDIVIERQISSFERILKHHKAVLTHTQSAD